jgi:hypothetical protein
MIFNGNLAGSWSLVVALLTLLATACSSENAPSEDNRSDSSGVARLHRGLVACPGPALAWSDEFSRTGLDTSEWTACNDDSVAGCETGNNEKQTYRDGNLKFSGYTLEIKALDDLSLRLWTTSDIPPDTRD